VLHSNDRVFFSDTSQGAEVRTGIFTRVSLSLGLNPIYYQGATSDKLGSNVAVEFKSDIYSSKLILIYVGPPTATNNVAFYYLPLALDPLQIPTLIYASEDFDRKLLFADTDCLPFTRIADNAGFEESLNRDLKRLISA
jgi:hypothetical protein